MKTHALINDIAEEAFGSVAGSFNIKIPKGSKTNLIVLVMRAVQAGATRAILADFLNQLATLITLSIGSKVVQKFDPIEYYEYVIRKLDEQGITGFAIPDDGTGADNQITEFIFPIFLCPLDAKALDAHYINPEYGFDGNKVVSLVIEYPADANELDGRLLSAYGVSIDEGTPTKIIEYEQLNRTFSATGTKQIISLAQDTSLKLFDLMFKETSYLVESLTAYEPTISKLSYQEDNLDKLFFEQRISHLEKLFHVSKSQISGARKFSDEYKIINFHESRDAKTSMPLAKTSQLTVEVLQAERLDWTQIRIAPLSYYN